MGGTRRSSNAQRSRSGFYRLEHEPKQRDVQEDVGRAAALAMEYLSFCGIAHHHRVAERRMRLGLPTGRM
jgi:hypothetical protein